MLNNKLSLFSFLKNEVYKTKNIINISYLIVVLKEMRLLILLVLNRYGLAFKYRIISQISIYNWMQNCIFWYFWYCVFIFLRSNLSLSRLVATAQMVCHMTSREQYHSSDSNVRQNIIRETIKVEKKRWIKIEFWRIPELMVHLEHDLYF